MRISEQWLREWVDFPGDAAELAQRITMAGLEVDAVEPAAPPFSGVVVGEIVDCSPHPEADRLSLCRVAAGGHEEPLPVVCGAPNARAGLRVPFAIVGARLPGDLTIRKAKLRGQTSHGMLCSARELGLSEDAAGLFELPADAPVGEDLRRYLALDDSVIEVDLTPNRSDCLGMAGVAREVGVIARVPVNGPRMDAIQPAMERRFPVTLSAPADCPRYLGRVVHGIDPAVSTPTWIAERLRRAGVRPLSVAVDVTNYVMLELGQPMHAFDLDTLRGGIDVRRARDGETLALLNGDTITLDSETLVIADHERPVALAGVMGGADTAVGERSASIMLEAAFFAPEVIAGRARAYGLHTDSSHRFERGVDPMLAERAMQRATGLLTRIAGGEPGPVVEALEEAHLPTRAEVMLRPSRVDLLLGTELPRAEMADILERLGMAVSAEGDSWRVQVPSWRFDIAREVDLIEEIARIHGYDRLPARRSSARTRMGAMPEGQGTRGRLARLLVDRGYQEAITYSFVSPELQAALDPERPALPLTNPLSADLAVMRTSLWPGLVRTLIHNRNRQATRVRLFELGRCFRGELERLDQPERLGGVICGQASPEHWGGSSRTVDFFDVKGDVEALLALTGEGSSFRFESAAHPALHPGQSARIRRDDAEAGWLGAVHPELARTLELPADTYLFELDLDTILKTRLPAFEPLSRFPSIRRDIAVLVDECVPAAAVLDSVKAAAGEHLRDLTIFDVYRGKGVESGRKSLAIGLILQDSSRTLRDDEVDGTIRLVVSRLARDTGATLRE